MPSRKLSLLPYLVVDHRMPISGDPAHARGEGTLHREAKKNLNPPALLAPLSASAPDPAPFVQSQLCTIGKLHMYTTPTPQLKEMIQKASTQLTVWRFLEGPGSRESMEAAALRPHLSLPISSSVFFYNELCSCVVCGKCVSLGSVSCSSRLTNLWDLMLWQN